MTSSAGQMEDLGKFIFSAYLSEIAFNKKKKRFRPENQHKAKTKFDLFKAR